MSQTASCDVVRSIGQALDGGGGGSGDIDSLFGPTIRGSGGGKGGGGAGGGAGGGGGGGGGMRTNVGVSEAQMTMHKRAFPGTEDLGGANKRSRSDSVPSFNDRSEISFNDNSYNDKSEISAGGARGPATRSLSSSTTLVARYVLVYSYTSAASSPGPGYTFLFS